MDKKSAINLFNRLIEPWMALGDDDEAMPKYRGFDPNDEALLKGRIASDLIPAFEAMPAEVKSQILKAVEFLRNSRDFNLEGHWNAYMPPFGLPDQKENFLKWISEVISQSLAH